MFDKKKGVLKLGVGSSYMPAVDSTAHPFGVSIIQSSEIICPYGGKVPEMFGKLIYAGSSLCAPMVILHAYLVISFGEIIL